MLKIDFYTVISEFCSYPKTEDVTLDFFNFLEEKYPEAWEGLNIFYADDWSQYDESDSNAKYYSPRLARHGWDSVAKKGNFHYFLPALKSIWLTITGQDYAKCHYCGEENELEIEHSLIASYDFAPKLKFYEAFEMDASMDVEVMCCRKCGIGMYKKLVDKTNPNSVECWA